MTCAIFKVLAIDGKEAWVLHDHPVNGITHLTYDLFALTPIPGPGQE